MATPSIRTTPPASGEAMDLESLPQTAPAIARSRKPRPMVIISTAKGGSPIIGRTTARSIRTPAKAIAAIAANTPQTKGKSRM